METSFNFGGYAKARCVAVGYPWSNAQQNGLERHSNCVAVPEGRRLQSTRGATSVQWKILGGVCSQKHRSGTAAGDLKSSVAQPAYHVVVALPAWTSAAILWDC